MCSITSISRFPRCLDYANGLRELGQLGKCRLYASFHPKYVFVLFKCLFHAASLTARLRVLCSVDAAAPCHDFPASCTVTAGSHTWSPDLNSMLFPRCLRVSTPILTAPETAYTWLKVLECASAFLIVTGSLCRVT